MAHIYKSDRARVIRTLVQAYVETPKEAAAMESSRERVIDAYTARLAEVWPEDVRPAFRRLRVVRKVSEVPVPVAGEARYGRLRVTKVPVHADYTARPWDERDIRPYPLEPEEDAPDHRLEIPVSFLSRYDDPDLDKVLGTEAYYHLADLAAEWYAARDTYRAAFQAKADAVRALVGNARSTKALLLNIPEEWHQTALGALGQTSQVDTLTPDKAREVLGLT